MMKNYTSFILILLSVSILTLIGCSSDEKESIRVAHNNWPGYEPLSLAKEKGFYQGVNVEIQRAASATDVIKYIELDAVDIAAVTLDEALLLQDRTSTPLWVITVLDISHGGDVIIAKQDIHSLNDLRGKRVGVEANALGAFMITRALEFAEDLGIDELRVVPLTNDQHAKSFENNEVDAVVTFEPVKSQLINIGGRVLFDSKRIPDEIIDVLIVKKDVGLDKADAIERVVAGYFRALHYISENSAEANRIMGGYGGLSKSEFQKVMSGMRIPGLEENHRLIGGDNPELVSTSGRVQEVLLNNKIILKPIDAAALFDGRFLPNENK